MFLGNSGDMAEISFNILRYIVPFLYLGTAVGYTINFIKNQETLPRWVRPLFTVAAGSHGILVILLFFKTGTIPLSHIFEALLLCSFVITLLYFLLEYLVKEICYGVFLLPINFVLLLVSLHLLDKGIPLPDTMMSAYFFFHTIKLITSFSCFFLSAIISIMYLLQYHEIKNKNLGFFFKRLPNLDSMDLSIGRINALGTVLLLGGLFSGLLWVYSMPTATYKMDIKIGFTVLSAMIYCIEVTTRFVLNWKGRRCALLSILGFICILMTLFIGRHGY